MRKTKRHGFTLVELLVTIAIIIILAALITAVSLKMKQAAKAAACVGNLRQMGTMIHTLREDGVHTGHTPPGSFPPYAGQISSPSKWRKFNIYELVGEAAGFCEFDEGDYQWSRHPSDTFLQNPLSKHKLCGSTEAPNMITHDNFEIAGGFCYNALVEGWVAAHTHESKVKNTRMTNIKDPALLIIMGEQNPEESAKIWMGPWDKVTPAGSYKEGSHCLFIDGHVQHLRNDYLASTEGRNKHLNPNASF
jgi:prepilin-type N-terminal cleavage/methylation domain-containing protein